MARRWLRLWKVDTRGWVHGTAVAASVLVVGSLARGAEESPIPAAEQDGDEQPTNAAARTSEEGATEATEEGAAGSGDLVMAGDGEEDPPPGAIAEPEEQEEPSDPFAEDYEDEFDGGGFISFGYIHSFDLSGEAGDGNGVELTYVLYPSGSHSDPEAIGVFFQAEHFRHPAGHDRLAAGLQYSENFYGLELGYATRTRGAGFAPTKGIHVGPFLSMGLFNLATRVTIPVAAPKDSWGKDVSIVLGIKLPLPIHGDHDFVNLNFGHGRPLRVVDSTEQTEPVGPPLGAIAALWSAMARDEHRSVPAFARIALQLSQLGAPLELIRRCHEAAIDEVHHTQLCDEVARAHGAPCTPRAIGESTTPLEPTSMDRLALESLLDGAYGEGAAAQVARRAARAARTPDLERRLGIIAEDEARHAELGWSIFEWALPRGTPGGDDALWRLLAQYDSPAALPHGAPEAIGAGGLSAGELVAIHSEIWELVRARALATVTVPECA